MKLIACFFGDASTCTSVFSSLPAAHCHSHCYASYFPRWSPLSLSRSCSFSAGPSFVIHVRAHALCPCDGQRTLRAQKTNTTLFDNAGIVDAIVRVPDTGFYGECTAARGGTRRHFICCVQDGTSSCPCTVLVIVFLCAVTAHACVFLARFLTSPRSS